MRRRPAASLAASLVKLYLQWMELYCAERLKQLSLQVSVSSVS